MIGKNPLVDYLTVIVNLPESFNLEYIVQVIFNLFLSENATDFYSLEHNLSLKLHEFRNVWSILGLNANFIRGTNNTAYS